MATSVNYIQPEAFPKNLGVDFRCSVGRWVYCTVEYLEPDNLKIDDFIYDMETGKFRNDLVPPRGTVARMDEYLLTL